MTQEILETRVQRRILGLHDSGVPGPTLVVLGGIHGNEPAGVDAIRRVIGYLGDQAVRLRGRIVGLAGNLEGLEQGRRYIDRDLNRAWLQRDLEALSDVSDADLAVEDREQRELVGVLRQCERDATGPVVFLDLHTSSAPGAPFSCMSDTLANRRIALALPIPMILGLEECIDGAVMEYFNRKGMVAVAVEGGMQSDPVSVDNLVAALWLVLDAARMLPAGSVDLDACRGTLARAARGLPRVLEILHRQHVEEGDEFVMEPGFQSFQKVTKGELLASYNGIPLRAPESCRVLLPLYQGQGEDGFFLVGAVSGFWLKVAAVLRRLRLQEIVHWLPGVRRHPELPDTLTVEPRIARVFAVQLFHLLGFRRRRIVDGLLCFSRRRDALLE